MEYIDKHIKHLKDKLEHKQEFTNIDERLNNLETIAVEDKTIAARNTVLIDIINKVQSDIRELQIEVNSMHKELGLFKNSIDSMAKVTNSDLGKLDVLDDVVAQHKVVLDSLTVKISEFDLKFNNTQDQVITIGHDEELENLKKMFIDFKKHALLIDNTKNE
ncbi:MAG: hypothetical protein K0B02_00340 [DPANN group archaeon]|nr:hypothetical protein [DPANN group archaeon]